MKWTWVSGLFVGYSALALAVTFPLALHLSSAVPHDLGDPLLSTALLWWNAHALPLTERWWNGFAFFPAGGTLAFSDHRLGASLIASPLQWLGYNAVTAYNLTFLVTFPLCAIAAHALGYVLTKRHDAAALCGLAYGFNPYRVAHLEHLELLAAFGMPAALAALHMYADTRRVRWVVAFAVAMILQGLCASYYLLFFSVFVLLWVLWFVRWRDWRFLVAVAAAGASAVIVLSPIAVGYWRIHRIYGFHRLLGELLTFSGDVTSLVSASPLSMLWGWTAALNPPEAQLFPGVTVAALALVGAIAARGARQPAHDRFDLPSTVLMLSALVLAMVALAAGLHGAPWRLTLGPFSVSAGAPYKPLSLAVVALIAGTAVSSQGRAAFRRRSPFAFYLIATAFLFLCSFGPKPTFLGMQILYEPPYAWLMRLPLLGDSVRVPARFAMPAVLSLAAAGALAFSRLRMPESLRRGIGMALMIGIVADGWISEMPLPQVPDIWPAARADGFAAVLELPPTDGLNDFAAMYRATHHGHRTVTGDSGYWPPHYIALRSALDEGDETALEAVAQSGTVLVVIDKQLDSGQRWDTFVRTVRHTTPLSGDNRWAFFSLAQAPAAPRCSSVELPIAGIVDQRGAVDVTKLTDRDPITWWVTPGSQQPGDMLIVDLGVPARLCSIRISLGDAVLTFPRLLNVATSLDGSRWESVFTGKTGELAIRAALERPREIWLEVPAASAMARHIRLRLEASHPSIPWLVSDLAVTGTPLPSSAGR